MARGPARLLARLLVVGALVAGGAAIAGVPVSAGTLIAHDAHGVPDCPAGTAIGFDDCVMPPMNDQVPPNPLPVITWTRNAVTQQTIGTWTATIPSQFHYCSNNSNPPTSEWPCTETNSVSAALRLYIPGATNPDRENVSMGPGTCTNTSCPETITLGGDTTEYEGPLYGIFHVGNLNIESGKGNIYQESYYEFSELLPANPTTGHEHPVAPKLAFSGTFTGSKTVKLAGKGVPAGAEGALVYVLTTQPGKVSGGAGFLNAGGASIAVKGTSFRFSMSKRGTAKVWVVGWVDGKPSTTGDLRACVGRRLKVKGKGSVSLANVYAQPNADQAIVSVGSYEGTSTVGGLPVVKGAAVGMVVPLKGGRLYFKLASSATIQVLGCFEPVAPIQASSRFDITRTQFMAYQLSVPNSV